MSVARGIRATNACAHEHSAHRHGFTGLIPADSFSMGTPGSNMGAVMSTGPFLFACASLSELRLESLPARHAG